MRPELETALESVAPSVEATVVFEDDAASNLLPLTWTRPVWDLRCGAWTLREAIEDAYSASVTHLYTRDHLAAVTREWRHLPVNVAPETGMVLCLNGRLLADHIYRAR